MNVCTRRLAPRRQVVFDARCEIPSTRLNLSQSRRAFLRGMAGNALVLPATGVLAASAESEPACAGIRKAVKYHMIEEGFSVLDKFKLLRDLGFDGTEIHVTTEIDKREVRRAIEATGVVVHGFLNSTKPDLRYAIDMAKFYGGTSVLVVAGRVNRDNPYDEVYRQQQARIKAALPYAEEWGIRLLVENVWNNFLLSPLEMARFIDELDSPAAGVYFDIGNVLRFGWPEQWIRILGSRIGKLDVKDYSEKLHRGGGHGLHAKIGEGDCDWAAVRQALAGIGYTSGWATAEVRGGDRRRLAEIARRMDDVLKLDDPT